MVLARIAWPELDQTLKDAITARCGPISDVTHVGAGFNSQLAITVHTSAGTRVFIKGLRTDQPRARTQQVEAAINPHVRAVAPRLLWSTTVAGWHLLAFEHLVGRRADYAPGSPDLPKIAACLLRLQAIPAPDLPLKLAEHRWRAYVDDPADLDHFVGDHLLHTDYNPDNVLITDRAHLVDWAWPTRGAGWIDPTLWALWLIAAGHTPTQAEHHAAQLPTWKTAPASAVTAFIKANSRLWAEIAKDDPDPWTVAVADAARRWAAYRSS
ncbi:MAG: aminoglycoside phosphotransferase [Frankia sp.]|nr:aminoglycoside phosphotransferase [Frankia sp.]